jgi:hypothetical protein
MPPIAQIDLQMALALVPVVGGFTTGLVWLIRLEGRVNRLDSESTDTKNDIRYIRERIDRALEREAER